MTDVGRGDTARTFRGKLAQGVERYGLQLLNEFHPYTSFVSHFFRIQNPFPEKLCLPSMVIGFLGSSTKAYLTHNVDKILYVCNEKQQKKSCCDTSN